MVCHVGLYEHAFLLIAMLILNNRGLHIMCIVLGYKDPQQWIID